jgi:hypothetical protein
MKTDTPTIPPYIASFLWSYDTDALDIKTHKTLIIPQILNIGSQRAVAWLRDTYTSEEIADAVKESVQVSVVYFEFLPSAIHSGSKT